MQLPIIGVDSSNTTVHSVQKLIKPTVVLKTHQQIKPRALTKDVSTDHTDSTAEDHGSYQAEPAQGEEGRNSESNQSWSDTESYKSKENSTPTGNAPEFLDKQTEVCAVPENHMYPQDQRETTNQKEEWLGILENIQHLIQVKVNLTAKRHAEPKVDVSMFSFFNFALGDTWACRVGLGDTWAYTVGLVNTWACRVGLGDTWAMQSWFGQHLGIIHSWFGQHLGIDN